MHPDLDSIGGPVTAANNALLTDFAIHAVEAQPLDYLRRRCFDDHGCSRSASRGIAYPGAGTMYYYNFHLHYAAKYTSSRRTTTPVDGRHRLPGLDGLRAPGARPWWIKVVATRSLVYQRVVFTYGPLLALIFLVGLGGVLRLRLGRRRLPRLSWSPRTGSMLPWVTAVALLVTPIAIADFDYRYLLPVIPFACLAAGLAFAPARVPPPPEPVPEPRDDLTSQVPGQVG